MVLIKIDQQQEQLKKRKTKPNLRWLRKRRTWITIVRLGMMIVRFWVIATRLFMVISWAVKALKAIAELLGWA